MMSQNYFPNFVYEDYYFTSECIINICEFTVFFTPEIQNLIQYNPLFWILLSKPGSVRSVV